MKLYHISELEKISGIKAHTIRIWEKRYKIIEPNRTSTNIRTYDDSQVRKLLNISTLLANGYKISKIADLTEHLLSEKVSEIQENCTGASVEISYINDLIASMIDFNRHKFQKTLEAAIAHYGMFDTMLKVLYPFLQKIGMMWAALNAMPVEEHFASSIIRATLIIHTQTQPIHMPKNKKFLLFLPPDEWHEIGLLFSDYIIRSSGIETIYLGQNVPYENVAEVIKITNPSHILTFFIAHKKPENLIFLRKKMNLPADIPLLLAGNREITDALEQEPNIIFLSSPYQLLEHL